MSKFQSLFDAVVKGDARAARSLTEEALAAGVAPLTLVNEAMAPAMDEVGRRFECSEAFVPELLLSARAMKSALELIRPLLIQSGTQPLAKVVVGTVRGDLHDIGKNLVAALLEGGGFEVIDLGTNVSPEKFVETVKTQGAQVVALSALLTTTMPGMRTTIDAFRAAGLRDQVKILVGGAPVTQKFADEIGADGYGENAPAAVHLARRALAGRAATG